MKKIFYIIAILLFTAVSSISQGADFIELKLAASNKIVFKFMFKNGSITDPKGKEGLTMLTMNLIGDGGTSQYTSTQLKDFLYPMATHVDYSVDKEVTIFTFEVHVDHVNKFYPVMIDLITKPRFDERDFNRIKSNLQNYV